MIQINKLFHDDIFIHQHGIKPLIQNRNVLISSVFKKITSDAFRILPKFTYISMYDPIRRELYGLTNKSYNGHGQCGIMTIILYDYLNKINQDPSKWIKIKERSIDEVEKKKLSVNNHMYLCITENNEDYIIDPTYKQLLIRNTGNINKFTSFYANYLYNLSPIFIGTKLDLSMLQNKLKNIRNYDKYHCDDEILDDWYDTV
jgi:hypothetical protein